MAISMLKIRRPLGRLIFNMGIAIPGKTIFLIEMAPWSREIWFAHNLCLNYPVVLKFAQSRTASLYIVHNSETISQRQN